MIERQPILIAWVSFSISMRLTVTTRYYLLRLAAKQRRQVQLVRDLRTPAQVSLFQSRLKFNNKMRLQRKLTCDAGEGTMKKGIR